MKKYKSILLILFTILPLVVVPVIPLTITSSEPSTSSYLDYWTPITPQSGATITTNVEQEFSALMRNPGDSDMSTMSNYGWFDYSTPSGSVISEQLPSIGSFTNCYESFDTDRLFYAPDDFYVPPPVYVQNSYAWWRVEQTYKGHDRVLRSYDTNAGYRASWRHDFTGTPTDVFTIEFWWTTESATTGTGNLFLLYDASSNNLANIGWVSTSQIGFYVAPTTNYMMSVEAGRWYHFRLEGDATTDTIQVFIDNVIKYSGSFTVAGGAPAWMQSDTNTANPGGTVSWFWDGFDVSWDDGYVTNRDAVDLSPLGNYNATQTFNEGPFETPSGWSTSGSVGCWAANYPGLPKGGADHGFGHKNLFVLSDYDGGASASASYTFSEIAVGSVEYWIYFTNVAPVSIISQAEAGYAWNIYTNGGTIYDSAYGSLGMTLSSYVWHHIRIEWDCNTDMKRFYLDGNYVIRCPLANPYDTINVVNFGTEIVSYGYQICIDALDVSDDPMYEIERNTALLLNSTYTPTTPGISAWRYQLDEQGVGSYYGDWTPVIVADAVVEPNLDLISEANVTTRWHVYDNSTLLTTNLLDYEWTIDEWACSGNMSIETNWAMLLEQFGNFMSEFVLYQNCYTVLSAQPDTTIGTDTIGPQLKNPSTYEYRGLFNISSNPYYYEDIWRNMTFKVGFYDSGWDFTPQYRTFNFSSIASFDENPTWNEVYPETEYLSQVLWDRVNISVMMYQTAALDTRHYSVADYNTTGTNIQAVLVPIRLVEYIRKIYQDAGNWLYFQDNVDESISMTSNYVAQEGDLIQLSLDTFSDATLYLNCSGDLLRIVGDGDVETFYVPKTGNVSICGEVSAGISFNVTYFNLLSGDIFYNATIDRQSHESILVGNMVTLTVVEELTLDEFTNTGQFFITYCSAGALSEVVYHSLDYNITDYSAFSLQLKSMNIDTDIARAEGFEVITLFMKFSAPVDYYQIYLENVTDVYYAFTDGAMDGYNSSWIANMLYEKPQPFGYWVYYLETPTDTCTPGYISYTFSSLYYMGLCKFNFRITNALVNVSICVNLTDYTLSLENSVSVTSKYTYTIFDLPTTYRDLYYGTSTSFGPEVYTIQTEKLDGSICHTSGQFAYLDVGYMQYHYENNLFSVIVAKGEEASGTPSIGWSYITIEGMIISFMVFDIPKKAGVTTTGVVTSTELYLNASGVMWRPSELGVTVKTVFKDTSDPDTYWWRFNEGTKNYIETIYDAAMGLPYDVDVLIYDGETLIGNESIQQYNPPQNVTIDIPSKYGYNVITSELKFIAPDGKSIPVDDLNITATRWFQNVTYTGQVGKTLEVDEGSPLFLNVTDTFGNAILSELVIAAEFIALFPEMYSFKIHNQMRTPTLVNLTRNVQTISYWITPGEAVANYLYAGDYDLDYTQTETWLSVSTTITLDSTSIYNITTEYRTIYFSAFANDGLGLPDDTVRLYVDGLRKDFGPVELLGDSHLLQAIDYFGVQLFSSTIDLSPYSEYNIFINMATILMNNKFNQTVQVTIEKNNVILLKQVLSATQGLPFRFTTGTYNIRVYNMTTGLEIEEERDTVELDTNSTEVVSFGYAEFAVEPARLQGIGLLDLILMAAITVVVTYVIMRNPIKSPLREQLKTTGAQVKPRKQLKKPNNRNNIKVKSATTGDITIDTLYQRQGV